MTGSVLSPVVAPWRNNASLTWTVFIAQFSNTSSHVHFTLYQNIGLKKREQSVINDASRLSIRHGSKRWMKREIRDGQFKIILEEAERR